MNEKNPCTDFLFPKSSIITGIGTVINIWGNYYTYNTSETEEEADSRAIACDWKMVGEDFKSAIEKVQVPL